MQMLANCYLSMGQTDACLNTLRLMKEQYPGTTWEHYADMRPAFVYEYAKGDAQRALQVYQESLKRYPTHIYWAYIDTEIKRLQKVIEDQLVQDSLEQITKADPPDCGGHAARQLGFRIVRDQHIAMAR
jgi:outer membrane protein assembly factor BamD (BamD/ComL family)